ncbi:MAG: hypothetical protein E4H10_01325 [Bacteroidia bacterium]|nr:MAG: hypothetical protein E4H10_01325 [Bacteroidia bacterium]
MAILLGLATVSLIAQSPYDPKFAPEAEKIQEQVQLFSDRNLYAVNEDIHFVAEHRVEGVVQSSFWSSVLYLELVAPTGNPVAQGKYLLFGGRAQGTLQIPASALTGDYYLKCYSRLMRNRGPASFSYLPVKIINPFRSEVAAHAGEDNSSGMLPRVPYREGGMECSTGSEVYNPGEEVNVLLTGTLPAYLEQLRCCLTVVPEGAIDLSGGQYIVPVGKVDEEAYQVSFLPDLGSGVSVSGTVVDAEQKPAIYATLHFSLLGESPDYFATISDENGRFIFTTPSGKGQQELFVTPPRVDGTTLEVRIDQEYDSRPLSLPWEKFQLSESEKELARRTSLNMQLSKAFISGIPLQESATPEPAAREPSKGTNIPFYGTRVKRLLIDDYVRLPNLEEVFINLVPDVQFYKKKGENKIRILSDNASISIYDPLIMVDHISVFDHEAVLGLLPEKIERIDLINEIYLKGNVAFGGILAIYSKKGDMAGIDLPDGSYFFDYQSFTPQSEVAEEFVRDMDEQTSGRVPDTRNTIYWRGDLQLKKGNSLEIPFRAPETPGEYVILVRGVDPMGEVLSATARFRVE